MPFIALPCASKSIAHNLRFRTAKRAVQRLCVVLVSLILCFVPSLVTAQSPTQLVVIRAGRLFDSASGRMMEHPVVFISENKIQSVLEGNAPISKEATVLDLGNATILPGFIDVHTHLTMNAGGGGYEGLGISTPRAALTGAKNARLMLMAGFTTVRNVGAEGYADVALRDAINAGDVVGPRMQASGPPIGISGGHCDNSLLPFEFHYSAEGVADGEEGSPEFRGSLSDSRCCSK